MEYTEVAIRDEFIRLGQAMKLAGILSLGSDIKYEIVDGNVKVNGEVEECSCLLYTSDAADE